MNIQVAITDRYRKAYRSLRHDEQKVIDLAIDEWMANPENTSSNFEKLSFMGSNIFSIRVNRAGRVIMAKFDGVYFLLHAEGQQHDKVNDWAKNKRIDRNSITGAIQIYTDPVELLEVNTPKETDKTEMPIFRTCTFEQLKIIGVPEGWINKILSITDEDEYVALWSYLPDDAIENLEAVKNGFEIKNLVTQIFDEHKKEKLPIEEQVVKQPGFEFLTEDESLAAVLKKDISLFRLYLHQTQKFLLDYDFKGPVKLTGMAGTGKTVVAIHKTKQLVERLPAGANPVFFTTYTKFLIKNIQSMFAEAKLDMSKLVVVNLHKFALQYAINLEIIDSNPDIIFEDRDDLKLWKKYCELYSIRNFLPQFLMEEYRQIIQEKHIISEQAYYDVPRTGRGDILVKSKRAEVWKVLSNFENFQRSENKYTFVDIIFTLNKYLERFPDLKPFSHVVCDEVQDFSNLELRLIRNLVPVGNNDLFLTGDPFQNIYQKRINFSESRIQIVGRSYRLKTNYRTTEQIQQFAFQPLKNQEFLDFDGQRVNITKCESLVFGNEPEQYMFKSQKAEFDFLAGYVQENFGQIGLHEICFATRQKDKLNELIDFFKEKRFPCINLENVDDLVQTEGKLVFSTLHGLKGLEFKNLVVFNFSNDTFPFKPVGFNKWTQEEIKTYLRSEYALLYVSFSRAISRLMVTGVGDTVVF